MKFSINTIATDITKLESLHKAVIDSSSVIYLFRLHLIDALGRVLRLTAPPAVFAETALSGLPIHKIESRNFAGLLPDAQVLELAWQEGCALIADDKKMLQKAAENGLDYFNTLMMVLLLYQRGILDRRETESKLKALYGFAHYAKSIRDYGRMMLEAMEPI